MTIISTIQPATINSTASTQGHALLAGEARKLSTQEAACTSVGLSFVPILVMKSLGEMSALAVITLAFIGRLLGQRLGIPTADSIQHLFQRCSISVWRGNAAMWLRRSPTFSPSIDGVFKLFTDDVYGMVWSTGIHLFIYYIFIIYLLVLLQFVYFFVYCSHAYLCCPYSPKK